MHVVRHSRPEQRPSPGKQGNKNIPPLKKQTKALLGNCSVTDESNRL